MLYIKHHKICGALSEARLAPHDKNSCYKSDDVKYQQLVAAHCSLAQRRGVNYVLMGSSAGKLKQVHLWPKLSDAYDTNEL